MNLNIAIYEDGDMRVVGIDPGISGGIAGLDTETNILWAIEMPVVENTKTKKFEYDIPRIAALMRASQPDHVCLEAVHSMPRDGKASAFKFGMGYGILLGIIGTLALRLTLVSPQKWKKTFTIGSDKEQSRTLASELFPLCTYFWRTKSREGVAEAALIARWVLNDPTYDTTAFLPHTV